MGKYYLHRISNEWKVSKPLFDKGYLTVGWSDLRNEGLTGISENKLNEDFLAKFGKYYDVKKRNKNCLKRFLLLKGEDIVVVPLPNGECAIVHIAPGEITHSILELPEEVRQSVKYDESVDLGFFIKYNLDSAKKLPREYTDSDLQSRMKVQMTNIEIDDLKKAVDDAMASGGPLNLCMEIQEGTKKAALNAIRKLNDRQFEKLVAWYFDKRGADSTVLPKWNGNKKDKEDADVKAEFSDLQITIFVQAKAHKGTTHSWAVEQITRYKETMSDAPKEVDDMTNVYWVISAADQFDDEAVDLAQKNHIRLINGSEFARMIINTGIDNINSVLR